ncbi:MAG: hypothetical protein KAH23_08715 [Kiritimatiellae bacterium]|nr:hypothetical protein [Kiritimatiellia bacterium]
MADGGLLNYPDFLKVAYRDCFDFLKVTLDYLYVEVGIVIGVMFSVDVVGSLLRSL